MSTVRHHLRHIFFDSETADSGDFDDFFVVRGRCMLLRFYCQLSSSNQRSVIEQEAGVAIFSLLLNRTVRFGFPYILLFS